MECSRCGSQIPDSSATCPVCKKTLQAGAGAPLGRVSLTGQDIPPSMPPPHTQSGPPTHPISPAVSPPDPQPHVVIHSSNPKVQAAIRHHPPAQTALQGPQERRWLIVHFALFGMLACLVLFVLSFTSAFDPSSVPNSYRRNSEFSPFLLATGMCYMMLSFVTWIALPAPWTHEVWNRGLLSVGGYRTRRINWVITLSGFLAVMVLVLMGINSPPDSIGSSYRTGYASNSAEADREYSLQKAQLAAWQQRVRVINRAGALSLLICFAGVAGYGAWWLRTRPVIPAINAQDNGGPWWSRQY